MSMGFLDFATNLGDLDLQQRNVSGYPLSLLRNMFFIICHATKRLNDKLGVNLSPEGEKNHWQSQQLYKTAL